MSLSATMWTSVSGLLNHGAKMNTIGNNIANINTVAYKSQRMDFADFVYQDKNTLAGVSQNGFGVQIGTIMSNFSQGSFESTTNATDLAISGNGYFQVNKVGTDEAYYTRAGNFNFDSSGYLLDPNGFALQGWQIDNSGGVTQASGSSILSDDSVQTSSILGTGSPTDIKLDTWYVYPQQTTSVDVRVNLPQEGADNATNTSNPFTALLNMWDGTQPPATEDTPAISQTSYSNQTTMTVYDEAGVQHTLTIYFDQIDSDDYEGGTSGESMWEYIVTMDPAEDMRQYYDETTGELTNVNETAMGGMLMAGTMTYNSSGALINQSAYTWGGTQTPEANPDSYETIADPSGGLLGLDVISLDPTDLNNWEPAAISSNGYPIVVANFSGILDAQTTGTSAGSVYNMEIDFGLNASNLSNPWSSSGSLADLSVDPYLYNAAYSATDATTGPEYVLLNTSYNSTLADAWDLSTNYYDIGGTALWTGVYALDSDVYNALAGSGNLTYSADGSTVAEADYARSLEYYNISSVGISAGSINSSNGSVPSENITLDLVTGNISNDYGYLSASDGMYYYDDGGVYDPSTGILTYADGVTTLDVGTGILSFTDSNGIACTYDTGTFELSYTDATHGACVYNNQTGQITVGGTTYTDVATAEADLGVTLTVPTIPDIPSTPGNPMFGITGADIGSGTAQAIYDTVLASSAGTFTNQLNTNITKASPSNLYLLTEATPANANYLAGFNDPVLAVDACTNFNGDFTSSTAQDGYGYGDLTSWSFDSDGVLYGIYSNGVTLGLWQVSLYDFTNDQGLDRVGGNLFAETKDSGSPTTGTAGSAGLGSISGYSLEQSNVDMSTEFVYMITTQRGYQSNSKLITTTDTMLETVINMKR